MTEGEALRIGRQAIEDARKRVGDQQEALIKETENRIANDPQVEQAFRVAGHLILQSQQETRH